MEINTITGDPTNKVEVVPPAPQEQNVPSSQVKTDKVFIGPDSLVYTSLREYKEYHGLI